MRSTIFLLIATFSLSCQNTTSPHLPDLGKEFELEYGEKIFVPEADKTIQFVDVVDESRCPIGVFCVWAGNAEIAFQFNDRTVNLNSYMEPKQTIVSGFGIELLSVSPYPEYNVDFEKKDYVVKIVITKK